jgi:hypothetical protein
MSESSESRRIARERKAIAMMIRMYCRDHHETACGGFCAVCEELHEYAMARLDRCVYGPDKPKCNKCPIHCYKPAMREKIREVMRYAGPRMLREHPVMALRHLVDSKKAAPERPSK